MLCHVMLRYHLRYVILIVMLCYVMLRRVMLRLRYALYIRPTVESEGCS